MPIVEVDFSVRMEYPEAFDFEDIRTLLHKVLEDAKAKGALNLPASESETGQEIKCVAIGQVWPEWRNVSNQPF